MRFGQGRGRRDGLAVAGLGFGEPSLLGQQISQVVHRDGEMRMGTYGPLKQFQGLVRAALLNGRNGHQVQRVGLIRCRLEDTGAEGRAAGQVAGLRQIARQV